MLSNSRKSRSPVHAIRWCARCDRPFTPTRRHARTCSGACRQALSYARKCQAMGKARKGEKAKQPPSTAKPLKPRIVETQRLYSQSLAVDDAGTANDAGPSRPARTRTKTHIERVYIPSAWPKNKGGHSQRSRSKGLVITSPTRFRVDAYGATEAERRALICIRTLILEGQTYRRVALSLRVFHPGACRGKTWHRTTVQRIALRMGLGARWRHG